VAVTAADESYDEAAAQAARLVGRIRTGDPAAEAELVERYSPGLSYLLRKITGDAALSDDLHQETFRIALHRIRAGELREAEKLSGFLRQTAKNLAFAEYRRGARWQGVEELQPERQPVDPAASQLSRLLQAEEAGLVRRLLQELKSSRDRQILYRFYIAEDDKETICRDLGLSSLHFNLVLFRARGRFRQLVEELEHRPPPPAGRELQAQERR
jgi:RNA polymerase sigma-70 factor (ECF subfamily)